LAVAEGEKIIGLDLGTTNCVVAVIEREGKRDVTDIDRS
jgi:molecular chaperone DnaK (HSP70)